MRSLIAYLITLKFFPFIAILVIGNLAVYWIVDWFVWTFGEEDIDVNHFRRMR